ncbi:MAG: LysE family translocator [Myxococcota bacterium]
MGQYCSHDVVYGRQFLALGAFALVSSITPGPNNLMLMASGTNFGFRRTIPHALGVSLGFGLMLAVVGAGLMQLLMAWPPAMVGLKVVASLYLVVLAVRIARTPAERPAASEDAPAGKPLSFIEAALFQWVNPKAWTMALTAISVFVPEEAPVSGVAHVVGAFIAVNLPSVSIWAFAGTQLRRWLESPVRMRAFNVTAGVLLLTTLYPIVRDTFG